MSPDGEKKKDIIKKQGFYMSTPNGKSMLPMLHPMQNTVVIRTAEGGIKRRDIVLYETPDGRHVLHRTVRVTDGGYVMRGDNCLSNEYGIKDSDIIGKMTSYFKDGKEISASSLPVRLYGVIWCLLYPFRRCTAKLKHGIARLFRI